MTLYKYIRICMPILVLLNCRFHNPHACRELIVNNEYRLIAKKTVDIDTTAESYYRLHYDEKGRYSKICYYKSGTLSSDPLFHVPAIEFSYTRNKEKREFLNNSRKPMENHKGVKINVLERVNSRMKWLRNYSTNNKLKNDINGVAQYKYTIDNKAKTLKVEHFDISGKQISDTDGHYILLLKFNKDGRVIEKSNQGEAGQKILSNMGIANTIYSYDNKGNKIKEAYYGVDNSLVKRIDYNCEMIAFAYDSLHRLKATKYLNKHGKPCAPFNELGNLIYTHTVGSDNNEEKVIGYGDINRMSKDIESAISSHSNAWLLTLPYIFSNNLAGKRKNCESIYTAKRPNQESFLKTVECNSSENAMIILDNMRETAHEYGYYLGYQKKNVGWPKAKEYVFKKLSYLTAKEKLLVMRGYVKLHIISKYADFNYRNVSHLLKTSFNIYSNEINDVVTRIVLQPLRDINGNAIPFYVEEYLYNDNGIHSATNYLGSNGKLLRSWGK